MLRQHLIAIAGIFCGSLLASSLQAAPIVGVIASASLPAGGASDISHIVDGSGLFDINTGQPAYNTSAFHGVAFADSTFVSGGANGETSGTIAFNLGGLFALDGMAVWNFNGFNDSSVGVKDLNILGSTDGVNFAPIAGAPNHFSIGAVRSAEPAELFAFATTAAFLRFNVLSSYGPFDFGLSEIMFTGTPSPVPLPSALTLLASGIVALWLARKRRYFFRSIALGFVPALLTVPIAQAKPIESDGVVSIDQSKALAGNITSGDTPGFPISITQSGSYRLTSDIVVPNAATIAIEISADRVTLDLNGFAIVGPVTCPQEFRFCQNDDVAFGEDRDGVRTASGLTLRNIIVKNGTISGMGNDGVHLKGSGHVIDRVHADNNGEHGIELDGGDVIDSNSSQNGRFGILLNNGTISHSTVTANHETGIVTNGAALVSSNIAIGNATNNLGPGSSAFGFVLSELTSCGGNASINNLFFCRIQIGPNQCQSAVCN